MPYIIGIDVGTGSTKAVAMEADGKLVATAQHHYTTLPGEPGRYEQDVEAIWMALVQCLSEMTYALQHPPAMVSLSTCMHSLLAVDGAGLPLTPLIGWADARSQAVAAELRHSAPVLYQATGTPLHAMSPLCKIIWFRQNCPALFAKAARWLSVKEFIWHRLFGVYEVDVSIAAATGLMNKDTQTWHEPALDLAGISGAQLSSIVTVTQIRKGLDAEAAAVLSPLVDVPFCIGSSDGCLANVGSNALQPGRAALTIGTSAAVRVATTRPVLDAASMLFAYPLHEKIFISGGALNNGGNVVQWALKKLCGVSDPGQKDYEMFYEAIAGVPAGSAGLLCLPYLMGERSPVWDEQSCGVYLGVRPHHTTAHFMRAALEGVCFALKEVLLQVEQATAPVQQLHVSGGFIHAALWLQLLADITEKPLHLIQDQDASATGAAWLGMEALGWAPAQHPEPVQVIRPRPDEAALYRPLFTIYKQLYPSLRASMHQLNNLQQRERI